MAEAPPPQLQLDPKDFPHVKFWFRREWSSRDAVGEKIFVETEDGNTVSESRLDDMRKHARVLWDDFLGEGAAPPKWGEATTQIRDRYCRSMCDKFPELRFCDKDWKAERIATLNYPSWYKYWGKLKKSRKRYKSVSRFLFFQFHYLL